MKDNLFYEKLVNGEKPVAVEFDSPAGTDLEKFFEGLKELKEAGTDIVTMADCPMGRVRMDSCMAGSLVKRELGIDVIPHMACRDRNSNAAHAMFLGLYADKIRNVILVTGDPIPDDMKDTVKNVFQFSSRGFIKFAASLEFPTPMRFYAALDINARNFSEELRIAKEKEKNGAAGFFTQPVLSPEAFENLKTAKAELSAFIMGGIIPVVSEKNARFMNESIGGMRVDEKIIEMYAGKDREKCEALAIEISTEIAKRISPYIDGYYLMTPFSRTALVSKIIRNIT